MAPSETWSIVAILTPAPGKEAELRDQLERVADQVHANEKDALRYEVTESVDGETKEFVVIEEYADKAAFEHHGGSDHFQAFAKTLKEKQLLAKAFEIKKTHRFGGFRSR